MHCGPFCPGTHLEVDIFGLHVTVDSGVFENVVTMTDPLRVHLIHGLGDGGGTTVLTSVRNAVETVLVGLLECALDKGICVGSIAGLIVTLTMSMGDKHNKYHNRMSIQSSK